MKIYEDKVFIPIKWTFCSDGQTLRSSVVGGYQAEIFKSVLTIIDINGQRISSKCCNSRKVGMQMARNQIARFLGSTI